MQTHNDRKHYIQGTESHYMYTYYHMKSLGTWLCVAMHTMSYIKIIYYVPSGDYNIILIFVGTNLFVDWPKNANINLYLLTL